MDARNLNVLFVGLGSIGTHHLQNLTAIAKKAGLWPADRRPAQ